MHKNDDFQKFSARLRKTGEKSTISKNDAVSAKHGSGSTININAKEDGTILNPDNTVQIYGNLDAQKQELSALAFLVKIPIGTALVSA